MEVPNFILTPPTIEKFVIPDLTLQSKIYDGVFNSHYKKRRSIPDIKNVIFNPPATIVFWADDTKTVVKAQGEDEFDAEKGLAMAISKKALGNKGNYCNEIKKWTEPWREEEDQIKVEKIRNKLEELSRKWRETYFG